MQMPPERGKTIQSRIGNQGRNEIKEQECCCICQAEILLGTNTVEDRPTGLFGSVEEWHYCPSCWSNMKYLRQYELDFELLFKAVFRGLEPRDGLTLPALDYDPSGQHAASA